MSTRWTGPQQAAIEHVRGDLLVSAAAGSGKTAVLAERCARLVCEISEADGGCGVDGLLVLTFTEASANEMRGRIAEAIREKLKAGGRRNVERARWLRRQSAMIDRASISTLHAFCARILRQHFHEAQIDPSFEVIDEEEARLMRDEVLTDLLAKWHAKHAAVREKNAAFAEFLEAYAQGRESTCRDVILKVYRILASTADPAGYVAMAREVYSESGAERTLERYVKEVVGGELRLLALSAERAVADVRSAVGPSEMLSGMQKARDLVLWAQGDLAARGAAALPEIRIGFDYKWATCKTLKDVPDFEKLKKRTWESSKAKMKAMVADSLATDAKGMVADLRKLAGPLETLLGLVEDFSVAYGAAKRGQNRLDFSDLERLSLSVLTAPGSLAAAELRARYCHLLVDEFQDINPLQAALLDKLRSEERFAGAGNLFVVGDVKQSIYGFRLAEPGLFLKREATARAATSADSRRYVGLPHNFRSHPNLLSTMNAFFEKMLTLEVTGITYTDGHGLQPPELPATTEPVDLTLLNGMPAEVHLVVMQQEEDEEEHGEPEELAAENLSAVEEEARMVAERIASLMGERRSLRQKDGKTRALKYRDIAILLRSMKDKAMIFARALARRGIPVHADLSTGYFDTAEVRDTLSLLQVLDNPQQDIPLATALLGPYGRFSHDDIAALRLTYDRKKVPFPDAVARYPEDGHLTEYMPDAGRSAPAFSPELADRLRTFLAKIANWRARLRTRPLHEGLAEIFAEARIFPYLAGTPAGSQRVANLQALHQRALKFAGFRKQGLHRFLRFIERLRDQEVDFGEAPVLSEASDVVRIMSVHKSKGLEFPVVFASGLGGMLNLMNPGPVFVHRDLGIGLQVVDIERNIFYHSAASRCITTSDERTNRAEELRLLYVAMTRARDHLILTGYIKKADELANARENWRDHDGPLPEDVLLKGRTSLNWLLPTLACCGLKTQWPGQNLAEAQVTVTLHAASGAKQSSPESELAKKDEMIGRLLAAEPFPAEGPADAAVNRLLTRVNGAYLHEKLARQPAVMTVSALKAMAEAELRGSEEIRGVPMGVLRRVGVDSRSDESRLRGTSTHRVLERLNFARCDSAERIAEQVTQMVVEKALTAEEAERTDVAGILWLMTQSTGGKRLVAAAEPRAAGDTSIEIRREIPFAWAAPMADQSDDPADWPTIRGVIDVLLVDRTAKTAEIFDYKTDAAFTWEKNAEGYAEQMRYYLQAAGEILGFKVDRATLLFLTPKQERTVTITVDGKVSVAQ
jgi:ATP-dependent helicase/nuclease subunit A